jgi:hypothetical protein
MNTRRLTWFGYDLLLLIVQLICVLLGLVDEGIPVDAPRVATSHWRCRPGERDSKWGGGDGEGEGEYL